MCTFLHSIPGRCLSLFLASSIALLGCEPEQSMSPSSGAPQFQAANFVAVPGGAVNAAGGNLLLERVDLSIDTLLGTSEIRATYNSHAEEWLWNFQITFDGAAFVDPTGATHDVAAVADGAPIPGTVWVKVDSDTVQTKGGLAFDFDADGKLASSHWAILPHPRIQYTWMDELLEIAQCTAVEVCMPFFWVELSAGARPTSAIDLRTGRLAEFEYDHQGHLIVARDALDVEKGWPGFRYEYGSFGGLLTALTNSEGERIEYQYVDRGKIRNVVQIGEGNPMHSFYYYAKNAAGLYRTVHTNPIGGETRYLFDADRRLHSRQLEDSGETHTVSWSADGSRRPTGEISPGGVTTAYTYEDDDLVTVTQPSGNVLSILYEPGGLNTDAPFLRAVRRIEDSVGLVEERSYDAHGRVVAIENGEGEAVAYGFNAAFLTSIHLPNGVSWSFSIFGSHGHWIQSEGPTADRRAFDTVGNPIITSTWHQIGGVLTRGYGPDRNVSSIDVAATEAGSVISDDFIAIEYRSDGRMTYIERPRGADHRFERDALGRLVGRGERVDGNWQTTKFEYDAAGNLTARERPNGMREEFEFDRYGRLLARRAFRDDALEGEATFTYVDGRLESVYDSIREGMEVYVWDASGRIGEVVFSSGESVTLEYDLRSRLSAETYVLPGTGSIQRIEYAYDLVDRRVGVSTVDEEVLIQRRYRNGLLDTVQYGNGLARHFTYDPEDGQLIGTVTFDGVGEVVEQSSISREIKQNPIRLSVEVDVETTVAFTRERYWFGVGGNLMDPDRFVGKRVWHWDDGEGASAEFTYDGLSNLVNGSAEGEFVYNGEGNRLLSAVPALGGETITYTYDSAGFATSRNGVPITWTATGRIASFGPATFEWDMSGRPVESRLGGLTRDLSLFGGRVERDPATGAVTAIDLGAVSIQLGSDGRTYRHRDFRGNVSFVSDDSGVVVTHYRYSPYGLDAVFGSGDDPIRFAGGTDAGDLVILGARIYDPSVGRFLSPDPVFQTLNQYAYTFGNPVFYWDPDGMNPSLAQLEQAYADAVEDVRVAMATLALALAGAVVMTTAGGPTGAAVSGGAFVLAARDLAAKLERADRAARALEAARAAGGVGGIGSAGGGVVSGLPRFGGGDGGVRNTAPSRRPPRYEDAIPGPFTGMAPGGLPIPGVGCAPTGFAAVPARSWVLAALVLLQLVLGALVLRERRFGRGGSNG
jgi:RHS repeat-associated protein